MTRQFTMIPHLDAVTGLALLLKLHPVLLPLGSAHGASHGGHHVLALGDVLVDHLVQRGEEVVIFRTGLV